MRRKEEEGVGERDGEFELERERRCRRKGVESMRRKVEGGVGRPEVDSEGRKEEGYVGCVRIKRVYGEEVIRYMVCAGQRKEVCAEENGVGM